MLPVLRVKFALVQPDMWLVTGILYPVDEKMQH
jgi:hypothetical protein